MIPLIDISDPDLLATWTAAMNAHASQLKTRNYPDLQLTRSRFRQLRAYTGLWLLHNALGG